MCSTIKYAHLENVPRKVCARNILGDYLFCYILGFRILHSFELYCTVMIHIGHKDFKIQVF